MKLLATSVVCLLLVTYAATAQKSEVTSRKSATPPTLEEVKAAGLLRSTFRKQLPRTKTGKAPKANLKSFREEIAPILKRACVQCHGAKKQEGNIRIDTLNPDLLHGKDVAWWIEVMAVVSNSEMPPADSTTLSDKDRSKVIEWLSSEIQVASTVRRAEGGHSSFRRMTRYEYNYALQDLLGLPWDFAKDLPPEANSADGFQDSSELLHMSVVQFETYRQLARKALKRATVSGKRPAVLHWSVSMKTAADREWPKQIEQVKKLKKKFKDDPARQKKEVDRLTASFKKPHRNAYYREKSTGRTARANWVYYGARYAFKPASSGPKIPASFNHVAIIPQGRNQRLTIELGNKVPDQGTMRVRVRASRTSTDDTRIPSMQLEFGWRASNEGRAVIRVSHEDTPIKTTTGHAKFYQWDIPLGEIYPRNSVRKTSKMGRMPSPSEFIRLVNSSVSQGDIQIDHVEVAAPVYDQWPPKSHTRIFFQSKTKANETAYAREVLTRFMSRAWHRDITAAEADQKMALFANLRPQCDSFQDAVVEVLATVISSPKFLYLVRTDQPRRTGQNTKAERLSGDELVTRLSMFLWSSTPDDALRKLAANGRLNDPGIWQQQVKRMLADPRSSRLSKHFVRGWLNMQLLDFLDINQNNRNFDPLLKEAMQEEPIAFFREILRNNRSVLDFIHSDYTMANERLAKHYRLKGVLGNHFRRVKLEPQHRRGGLLTQAGLLAMNSDGKDSHPLKRGVWLLEKLLNDPPPPPPPAVPEIDLADPEIAKLTLKERIENHRNHVACKSCHVKIDPWGIAFENFDAIGNWRDQIAGKPVDASSLLFNKQKLDGMDGLKRYLLKNRQDQFVRAMVHKMTTYALGRPLTFADRSRIDNITADVRKQGDGLATMIRLVAASELFQSR